MTQSTSEPSAASGVIITITLATGFTVGALFGLSSLLGTSWWVNLIIVLLSAVATIATFGSQPDGGIALVGLLGLFSIYGFVSALGWIATVAIVVAVTVLVLLLASEGPASEGPAPEGPASDSPAPRPPPRRARAPVPQSPAPVPQTASDRTLTRYAREFLAVGGARQTGAVVDALRSRVREEGLELASDEDLSSIASHALDTSRPPTAPTAARPARSTQGAVPKPKGNAREDLHEFGSFEIERTISSILDETPGITDPDLVDRVLKALGTADRSPFAMERLSDAVRRVTGIASPSAEERQAQQRDRRIARVPRRDPGGRTKLLEYGSHELERVVENVLAADRELVANGLHEAVLEVLGIEDHSNLGRERVANAAAKVSASPARSSRTGGEQRRPVPKKKATTTSSTPKKAAEEQQKPKPPAKKVTKNSTQGTARQKPAPTPGPSRQTGRKTPPPTPAEKPSAPASDEGTPDVKDIAKLLGL